MIEIRDREVRYDEYCHNCKNNGKDDNEMPCRECLEENVRDQTEKPLKYEAF